MSIKFGYQHGTNAAFLKLKTEDYLKSIQYCDKAGYESTFMMDHLNSSPLTAEIPSCPILLSAAALKTQNLKIGSCVTDPHRRQPAQIALDSLTLQKLSNNRFILGIGAGEGMNTNDFGIDWNKPATRLFEAVEVIKLLWESSQKRKKTVNYTGNFYNLKNARLQYPIKLLPKLWIGANGSRTIEFTGKVADGWIPVFQSPKMYKERLKILEKFGRIDEIEKALEIFICISNENPEAAKNMARGMASIACLDPLFLDDYNIKIPEEFQFHDHYKASLSERLELQNACMNYAKENVPPELVDSLVISGTTADCIEQFDDFIKAGVEHFVIEIFGMGDHFTVLELFTKEVLRYFKEESTIS
ncbi:MAG: LLM class flavin-dependent oxidoreductase [Candidatus Hodarchaeota archaeon]